MSSKLVTKHITALAYNPTIKLSMPKYTAIHAWNYMYQKKKEVKLMQKQKIYVLYKIQQLEVEPLHVHRSPKVSYASFHGVKGFSHFFTEDYSHIFYYTIGFC